MNSTVDNEIVSYWNGRARTYSNGVRGELGDARREYWESVIGDATADVMRACDAQGRPPLVLDLGCGPGFFSILFAKRGCLVHAVDSSPEMLSQARTNVSAARMQGRVTFRQHDISTLSCPDDMYDLAVGRNVTWLMRDPEGAYAEWLRVLRPGGKLLMFDANWYQYLVDPQVDAARRRDQESNVLEGWDEDAQATSDEEKRCEEIATHLPLTYKVRPAWDLEVLNRLGASSARADVDIWKRLWTESERRYYASSPMFMVEAVK